MNDEGNTELTPEEREAEAVARRSIVELCRLLMRQEREVAILEKDLENAKAEMLKTKEVDLPQAMMAAGISLERLSDGATAELKTGYYPKELKSDEGLEYLERAGAGELIEHTIHMQFGRSQAKLVAQIMRRVAKWKAASTFKLMDKRSVNAMRLK